MAKDLKYDIFPEAEAELSVWDDDDVAFIKNGVHDGKEMWLIYASDGTKIAATDDRDFAFIMARQNDLMPKSVH
ncbi:MAG: DUF1150 family protein [Alphaproteobacteria bacterium]|nr:DUF1150 family protein [Alphaproteobacteria bacterium]